jgi:enoyl-CoA hydratase/carnithine racemase
MGADILFEHARGVATLTLNRPDRKNAITPPMWTELATLFDRVAVEPSVRVLVVTGAGGAFSSGADLATMAADIGSGARPPALDQMRAVSRAVLALQRLPKPTIASVPSVAVGGGWNLALACDLVIAARSARFSQIFTTRGLSIDVGGSWMLPRLVGLQKAKELAFMATIISAAEADELGLVNLVVPDEALAATVSEWAQRLAAGPPVALSLTKVLLNQSLELGLEHALDAEASAQALNHATDDTAEALNAFVEKREPRFAGGSTTL